ncbi:MAG: ATPase [Sphingomonas bacterium]|uniref:ATP12 family chaperone protein n=1 Tax=Sphingomonas bacterium TaxID=1895847 RepID=UPI00262C27C3|nr:ATP12 family protein [Sphingomonas bacterium]MDB5695344.1 ATPase [Sphingomonas bacterium]
MKRFWTEVTVTPDRGVTLDGKPIRTPGRVPLSLPTDALAEAVAEEWRRVTSVVDPRAMPLTGLANAAIDRIALDPSAFAAGLSHYAETDLLCYRAELPEPLVQRQAAAWDPVIAWAEHRYDVHVEVTVGIVHRAQSPLMLQRLSDATAALDAFALAAASPMVSITGSLLLTLALVEGALTPDQAWLAAHVDEDWQAEMWGKDTLAAEAQENKRAEFDAAVRLLSLSRRRDPPRQKTTSTALDPE